MLPPPSLSSSCRGFTVARRVCSVVGSSSTTCVSMNGPPSAILVRGHSPAKATIAVFLLYPVQDLMSGSECQLSIRARDDQGCWCQAGDCSKPALADSRASNDISQAVQVTEDCSCQLLILKHVFRTLHRHKNCKDRDRRLSKCCLLRTPQSQLIILRTPQSQLITYTQVEATKLRLSRDDDIHLRGGHAVWLSMGTGAVSGTAANTGAGC